MNRTTSYTRSNRKSYKPVLVPKIKYHKTIKITKKTNPYGKIMIEEETHKNGSVFIKTHYVEKDTINEFRKLTNYSKYLTITEEANTLKTLDLGINPNFKFNSITFFTITPCALSGEPFQINFNYILNQISRH